MTTIVESESIAAPAAEVLALVTDVTNIGQWSPECYRCEWLDGAGPRAKPGDRFRGWNRRGPRMRWSTVCEVLAADDSTFSFAVAGAAGARTEWTYAVESTPTGCQVTEECRMVPRKPTVGQMLFRRLILAPLFGRSDRNQELSDGMRATLAALKAAAETPSRRQEIHHG
jgi:hypothetical protein